MGRRGLRAQVADDVERVVLTLGSGFEVDATVAEGFALAWWPQEGSGAESVDAVAITLIDESGAVVEEIKIPAVPSQ